MSSFKKLVWKPSTLKGPNCSRSLHVHVGVYPDNFTIANRQKVLFASAYVCDKI